MSKCLFIWMVFVIAFCTTCKGRTQHLELTLPRNLEGNADYPDCKFVVLDYNSQDWLSTFILSKHKRDIDSGRLVVYSMLPGDSGPVPFHMAHAKNLAHRCGILEGANVLVNLDADNFTCSGFAAYIAEQICEPNTYLWSRMIPGQFRRGISGRIAVTKSAFLKAGGYDEKYDTWSPDDKDFNVRLRNLGYVGKEIDEQFLDAVSHNDKMRFKEYKHASTSIKDEGQFDLSGCTTTVVNWGQVGCGTVYRNFDFSQPITLDPIPTRIFGIGLHKTATTSLHKALKLLGYDSAHWPSAHWAKTVWSEVTAHGRSATLERHYAACDLPIAIVYKELDRAYPGSKFILTVRSVPNWLKSVEKHFDYETNPFRSAWDTDPFSHRIHLDIYGRRKFDEEVFLARYLRHNDEVARYFGKRDDLLIHNVDTGDGWPELCEFLGQPTPDCPYPRANGGDS
jgi:hypothetical protein